MTSDLTGNFGDNAQPKGTFVPSVTEKTADGFITSDIFSRLLKDRVIYFGDGVHTTSAAIAIAQIKQLNAVDPHTPIQFIINSPGGAVTEGLAILDAMRESEAPIVTIGTGINASMGSFLLAAGTKGMRFMTANDRNMVHQIAGGSQGKEREMAGSLEFSKDLNTTLHLHYKGFTGMNNYEYTLFCKMAKDDTYVNPLVAQKMGLCDFIMPPRGYRQPDREDVTEEFDRQIKIYQHQLDKIMAQEEKSVGEAGADPKSENEAEIFDYDPNLDNYLRVKQIIESREMRGANGPAIPLDAVEAANDDVKPAVEEKKAPAKKSVRKPKSP